MSPGSAQPIRHTDKQIASANNNARFLKIRFIKGSPFFLLFIKAMGRFVCPFVFVRAVAFFGGCAVVATAPHARRLHLLAA
jgi:hypothetical protein